MKIYEGNILTCDAQNHVYKYLVEDGGRIAYVGDELPAKYVSGTHVKLGDRALIPAFGDSHIHFASFATFNAGLNVSAARSTGCFHKRSHLGLQMTVLVFVNAGGIYCERRKKQNSSAFFL